MSTLPESTKREFMSAVDTGYILAVDDTSSSLRLLTEILSLTKKNDQLLASYVKKIRKATGPVTAMQFHQIEMYILSEIRVSIASSLPYPEIKQ